MAARRKKFADFEESELEDLLYAPAVGNGTASHLLRKAPESSSLPRPALQAEENNTDETTVDPSIETTGPSSDASTVVTSIEPTVVQAALYLNDSNNLSTDETTVDPLVKPNVSGAAAKLSALT